MRCRFGPVLFGLLLGGFFGLALPAQAEPLLSVAGPAGRVVHFDRAALAGMPQSEIRTTTEWTDGASRFRGVLARDFFRIAGLDGQTVRAIAANDYAVEIPFKDFQDYDVILATEMDGRRLTLRDKGPIWIVYPRDDHEALQDPAFNARWIWQLVRLEVR